jgi:ubiquinone/menaquinone biosynthesis C-methylase UbiE
MFNNAVNIHDFAVLYRKVRQQGNLKIISKLFRNNEKRIQSSWSHTEALSSHWWDIPQVVDRWNVLITNSENRDHYRYIADKYFSDQDSIEGISLGCGTGSREVNWVRACTTLNLVGCDISPQRIAQAQENARKCGVESRLTFLVANVYDVDFCEEKYDLIVFEGSLHHLHSHHELFQKIHRGLKRNGILVVNDFVGPSRFQWTSRQLELVNGLLKILPETYRREYYDGKIKKRVYRPGKLSMYLSDPSEAVESGSIEMHLHNNFRIVEKRPYGGTLLQTLFKDIAHNFLNDEPATHALLKLIFEVEDEMLRTGEIKSDFIFFVCQKK